MSRCTMHDLDIECGPSSFHIPELPSNVSALPETGVLTFYRVIICGYNALWTDFPVCSFNVT